MMINPPITNEEVVYAALQLEYISDTDNNMLADHHELMTSLYQLNREILKFPSDNLKRKFGMLDLI